MKHQILLTFTLNKQNKKEDFLKNNFCFSHHITHYANELLSPLLPQTKPKTNSIEWPTLYSSNATPLKKEEKA